MWESRPSELTVDLEAQTVGPFPFEPFERQRLLKGSTTSREIAGFESRRPSPLDTTSL